MGCSVECGKFLERAIKILKNLIQAMDYLSMHGCRFLSRTKENDYAETKSES